MAQNFTKNKLSSSTNGRGIKIAATATAGTAIHTAVAGTTDYDEIYLYAFNSDTLDRLLTIEWGGTTAPDDNIVVSVPARQGRSLVVDGAILNNGVTVAAFASVTNVIVITGFVNEIRA